MNLDPTIEEISNELIVTGEWSEKRFNYIKDKVKAHEFSINIDSAKLNELRAMLDDKGAIFLRLIENPSILENERFTDLLRAFLHLKEELLYRGDFIKLPDLDIHHLTGDIKRVYSLLAYQWLDYIRHLKEHYPYLFSLATRMNPFDKERSPVVR